MSKPILFSDKFEIYKFRVVKCHFLHNTKHFDEITGVAYEKALSFNRSVWTKIQIFKVFFLHIFDVWFQNCSEILLKFACDEKKLFKFNGFIN